MKPFWRTKKLAVFYWGEKWQFYFPQLVIDHWHKHRQYWWKRLLWKVIEAGYFICCSMACYCTCTLKTVCTACCYLLHILHVCSHQPVIQQICTSKPTCTVHGGEICIDLITIYSPLWPDVQSSPLGPQYCRFGHVDSIAVMVVVIVYVTKPGENAKLDNTLLACTF